MLMYEGLLSPTRCVNTLCVRVNTQIKGKVQNWLLLQNNKIIIRKQTWCELKGPIIQNNYFD